MSKYIIANIKIPFEFFDSGDSKAHPDRANIEFIPCDELPQVNNEKYHSFIKTLTEQLSNNHSEKEEEYIIQQKQPYIPLESNKQEESTVLEKPTQEDQIRLIISPDEIKNKSKKHSINSTFKTTHKKNHAHNYTSKTYN